MNRRDMIASGLLAGILAIVVASDGLAAVHHVPADQPTIQAGVDAAAPGDTVLVAAGVHEEQVVITTPLTLLGEGRDSTTLRAPAALPHAVGTAELRAVICVETPATDVTVRGLTIDGQGRHPETGRFVGLLYYRTVGLIEDVHVTGIHEAEPSDLISGIGVMVSGGFQNPLPAMTIRDVTVERFQKTGVAVSGQLADALLERVVVHPLDIYSDAVQNGIELSFLPQVALRDCAVTGVYYDGTPYPDYTSAGVLSYYSNVVQVSDCELVDNQSGIYLVHARADVQRTSILAPDDLAIYCHGLVAVSTVVPGARDAQERVPAPRPLLETENPPDRPQGTYQVRVRDSRLDGKQRAASRGLALRSTTAEALDFVAERCEVVGWETGVTAIESSISNVYARLSGCQIQDNQSYGIFASTGSPVDARGSWFGHSTGPYHPLTNPGGLGDTVTDQVHYDLWLTGNVAVLPRPQVISLADEDGTAYTDTVTLSYLGGADQPIYGFSAELAWDPDVVTAVAIERPAAGPFADAVAFLVVPTGTGAVIDAAVGGAQDGAERGELCRVRFAAVGTPDWTRSPIQLTLHHARDRNNQEIGGLSTDAGALDVDLQAPSIAAPVIQNESLPHTDRHGKDGDQISVRVSTSDGDPAFGRTSIRGIGPGIFGTAVFYDFPDLYIAGQALWATRPAVFSPPDGPASFWVEARDPSGNFSVQLADTIIADNTPPAPVTGLQAVPGHNSVQLAWDDPAGGDLNFRQATVRYARWQDYPFYDGPAPDFPADPTAGEPAYLGPDTTATLVFAADGSERDILAIAAYSEDLAGNRSPLGDSSTALATSYRLGDVRGEPVGSPGDGVIDLYDITRLGDTYGRVRTEPGFDGDCDVAPALGGPAGIPEPDESIDLDDLMIFADQFALDQTTGQAIAAAADLAAARITAGDAPPATTTPQLAWRRTAPRVWSLVLEAPCPALKGLALQDPAAPHAGSVPDGVSLRLEPGPLLVQQPAPHFLHAAGGGLSAHLAVLGHATGVIGHGELLRLVSDRPVDLPTPTIDARDVTLGSLPTSLPTAAPDSDPEDPGPGASGAVPAVFASHGPHPNPFNPATALAFDLPSAQTVEVTVYALDGRRVRTLLQDALPAGHHTARWDGRDHAGRPAAAGTYLYRLQAGPWSATGKLELVK